VLQYSWACENHAGLHIKEGVLNFEEPPRNLIHVWETLFKHIFIHYQDFGLDFDTLLMPWRPTEERR